MVKIVSILILCCFACELIALPTSLSDGVGDVYEFENNLDPEIERVSRGALGSIGKIAAKMFGNAVTYTAVAVGVNELQKQIDKKDASPKVVREPIDCKLNNFGCLNGKCWANCGPRLSTSDYCLTTKGLLNETAQMNIQHLNYTIHNPKYGIVVPSQYDDNLNHFIPYAKCVTKMDCNSCYECAGSCIKDQSSEATFDPTDDA